MVQVNKKLAARFYQLKTGDCLTGQCLQWTTGSQTPSAGGVTTRPKHESICSRTAHSGKKPEGSVGGGQRRSRLGQRPVQDLGALRRREMQQGDPRLPGNNGSRTDSGPPVADEEPGRGLVMGREDARKGRWERGRKIRGRGYYRLSFFLFFFSFLFHVKHRKAEEGRARKPHRGGDLGGSVVARKRVL